MSNYSAFDIVIDNDDGEPQTPAGILTINVYDVTNDAALDDIASDADGHVDAGTLDVDAGTVVRFTAADTQGRAAFAEILTT